MPFPRNFFFTAKQSRFTIIAVLKVNEAYPKIVPSDKLQFPMRVSFFEQKDREDNKK